jgi:hypothetical protein
MGIFFNIFRKPMIKSQADHYPTLYNVVPDYLHMIHQLNTWQLQTAQPILQKAVIAAHAVLSDYFKKSLATRHSLIATLCDPRYKMKALAFFSQADGGFDSGLYKKGKAHLQYVYSTYSRRAVGVKEYHRKVAEDEAIDAIESRSLSPKGEDDWRTNPFNGYADFEVPDQQPMITAIGINNEVVRWLREPCITKDSTLEEVKLHLQSKAFDFPIMMEIARDFLAIPAMSAPSKRVFSLAGNLILKKRTSIASENVRYVLCLWSWGVLMEPEDEEELLFNENGKIIKPSKAVDLTFVL